MREPVEPQNQYFALRLLKALTIGIATIAVVVLLVAIVRPFVLSQVNNDISNGELTVRDAWIRPAQTSEMSAAYFTIENPTDTAERLTQVSVATVRSATLHQTQIDKRGLAQMIPLPDGIEIPAYTTVSAAPGGIHTMLMGMQTALQTGAKVELTLQFASGKTLSIEALVSDFPPQQ